MKTVHTAMNSIRYWITIAAVILIATGYSSGARCASTCTLTTLTLPSGSVTHGTQVTISGTITQTGPLIGCNDGHGGTAVTTGSVELREYEVLGAPVSCSVDGICSQGKVGSTCVTKADCGTNGLCKFPSFVVISSGTPSSSGQHSTVFNTGTLTSQQTSIGFLADYVPATGFAKSTSQCFDLTVAP